MPNQQIAPPGSVFVQPQYSTTAVPIPLTGLALQNTGAATLAGCNTALVTTTAAHGYTELLLPNGIKSITNPTTHHGPTSFGGGSQQGTFTYFQITGATGNTSVNGFTFAVYRVLSTTTMLIAMPATGAAPTLTTANLVPVLIPACGTYVVWLGANCSVTVNPDNTGAPYQFPSQPGPPTPVWTQLLAPSTAAQLDFEGPAGQTIILASGAAGTTTWSQYAR